MTIDKKVLLWTWIYRSLGLIAANAVFQESWIWATVFGIMLAGSSEIKDYYLKQQMPKI